MRKRTDSIFLCLVASICLACSSIPDGKIQGDIAEKLTALGFNNVSVVVRYGVVTLAGQVPHQTSLFQVETIAKAVDGVKSVQNNAIVIAPTTEPPPVSENQVDSESEQEPSDVSSKLGGFTGSPGMQPSAEWVIRANTFLRDYMKSRMVNCGDSWFLLIGKGRLYETKRRPFPAAWDARILPAVEPSEADKLNGKTKGLPERFDGSWRLVIEGPWRSLGDGRWRAWRDDAVTINQNIDYTAEEKWQVGPSLDGNFSPIGGYQCYGSDIDVFSISESNESDSKDISATYGKVGNVIFNKTTMTVFTQPAEFFKDSGKKSFDGLKYDEQNELPRGLKFVNGRALTGADYERLQ